jgi:hypothetical protein
MGVKLQNTFGMPSKLGGISTHIEIIYEKDIILRYIRDGNDFKVFNCCILIGKAMIHQQKSIDKQPDIYRFHCDLKEFLAVESQISLNKNQLAVLEKDWGELLEI